MDLKESRELTEFRAKIGEWISAYLPATLREPFEYEGMGAPSGQEAWYASLVEKNWFACNWPRQYGGAGFSVPEQIIFTDECIRQGAPVPTGFGIRMVGPLILEFGEDWQKQRFLPPIARNAEQWCQGYSEPNAGSDLAALQTRAVLEGEHFIVNGQKIWTSRAHKADWIFVLVRTSNEGKPQQGISFLLVDMKSPGVSIKPIRQLDGHAEFFETFFDEVKVPAKNLVGQINQGWGMAKALLAHERVGTGTNVDLDGLLKRIRRLTDSYGGEEGAMRKDPSFRRKLARLEMDRDCLAATRYRMLTAMMQGRVPGPESSIFKLYQSELCQRVYDLALEVMGPDAACWYDERLAPDAFAMPMAMTITRAMSIYAGSNEVQRNIIAKQVLQLP